MIADEPASALDVSIGAQILGLLARLQREFSLTLIFDFAQPSSGGATREPHRRDAGWKIVEIGAAEQVLASPREAYTRSLIASVPGIPA